MTIKIKGAKELTKALNDLPEKVFVQVIRRANTEAMKPVSQAMKQHARGLDITMDQAKALSKSIGRRTKVYKRDGVVVTVVGPRVFSEYDDSDGNRRRLAYNKIEFGGVSRSGFQFKPKPFMRNTWDSMNRSVEANYGRSVDTGLKKIAAREARKSLKK